MAEEEGSPLLLDTGQPSRRRRGGFLPSLLFVQVQVVTLWLFKNSLQMHQLSNNVHEQESQTKQIADTVHQDEKRAILHLAGTFVLLTCLIVVFHAGHHLRNYEEPLIQRKIVTILCLPPIAGMASWMSLSVPSTREYLLLVKDFYEAYCIYTFFSLLMAMLLVGRKPSSNNSSHGDARSEVIQILSQQQDHLPKPYRCWSSWIRSKTAGGNDAAAAAILLECQILVMQFVLVRPLTGMATLLVHLVSILTEDDDKETGEDDSSSSILSSVVRNPNTYILLIQNISVACAFAGLVKFYHVVQEPLQWCQPLAKFWSLKGIVFITFWQGVVLRVLGGMVLHSSSSSSVQSMQDILLCAEMLLFGLIHICVFSADEWQPGYCRQRQRGQLAQNPVVEGVADFYADVQHVVQHTTRKEETTTTSLLV